MLLGTERSLTALFYSNPVDNVLRILPPGDADRYMELKNNGIDPESVDDWRFYAKVNRQITTNALHLDKFQKETIARHKELEATEVGGYFTKRMGQAFTDEFIKFSPLQSVLSARDAAMFGLPELAHFNEQRTGDPTSPRAADRVGDPVDTRVGIMGKAFRAITELGNSKIFPNNPINTIITDNGFVGISLADADASSQQVGKSVGEFMFGADEVQQREWAANNTWWDLGARVGGLLGAMALTGFTKGSIDGLVRRKLVAKGLTLNNKGFKAGFSAGWGWGDDIFFGGALGRGWSPALKAGRWLERIGGKLRTSVQEEEVARRLLTEGFKTAGQTAGISKVGRGLVELGRGIQKAGSTPIVAGQSFDMLLGRGVQTALTRGGKEIGGGARDIQNMATDAWGLERGMLLDSVDEAPFFEVGDWLLPKDFVYAAFADMFFAAGLGAGISGVAEVLGGAVRLAKRPWSRTAERLVDESLDLGGLSAEGRFQRNPAQIYSRLERLDRRDPGTIVRSVVDGGEVGDEIAGTAVRKTPANLLQRGEASLPDKSVITSETIYPPPDYKAKEVGVYDFPPEVQKVTNPKGADTRPSANDLLQRVEGMGNTLDEAAAEIQRIAWASPEGSPLRELIRTADLPLNLRTDGQAQGAWALLYRTENIVDSVVHPKFGDLAPSINRETISGAAASPQKTQRLEEALEQQFNLNPARAEVALENTAKDFNLTPDQVRQFIQENATSPTVRSKEISNAASNHYQTLGINDTDLRRADVFQGVDANAASKADPGMLHRAEIDPFESPDFLARATSHSRDAVQFGGYTGVDEAAWAYEMDLALAPSRAREAFTDAAVVSKMEETLEKLESAVAISEAEFARQARSGGLQEGQKVTVGGVDRFISLDAKGNVTLRTRDEILIDAVNNRVRQKSDPVGARLRKPLRDRVMAAIFQSRKAGAKKTTSIGIGTKGIRQMERLFGERSPEGIEFAQFLENVRRQFGNDSVGGEAAAFMLERQQGDVLTTGIMNTRGILNSFKEAYRRLSAVALADGEFGVVGASGRNRLVGEIYADDLVDRKYGNGVSVMDKNFPGKIGSGKARDLVKDIREFSQESLKHMPDEFPVFVPVEDTGQLLKRGSRLPGGETAIPVKTDAVDASLYMLEETALNKRVKKVLEKFLGNGKNATPQKTIAAFNNGTLAGKIARELKLVGLDVPVDRIRISELEAEVYPALKNDVIASLVQRLRKETRTGQKLKLGDALQVDAETRPLINELDPKTGKPKKQPKKRKSQALTAGMRDTVFTEVLNAEALQGLTKKEITALKKDLAASIDNSKNPADIVTGKVLIANVLRNLDESVRNVSKRASFVGSNGLAGTVRVYTEPIGLVASFMVRKSDVAVALRPTLGVDGLIIQTARLRPLATETLEATRLNAAMLLRGVEGADEGMIRQLVDQLVDAKKVEELANAGARLTLNGNKLINADTGEVLTDTFREVYGEVRKTARNVEVETPTLRGPLGGKKGIAAALKKSLAAADIEPNAFMAKLRTDIRAKSKVAKVPEPYEFSSDGVEISGTLQPGSVDIKNAVVEFPVSKAKEDFLTLTVAGEKIPIVQPGAVEGRGHIMVPVAALDSAKLNEVEVSLVKQLKARLPGLTDEQLLRVGTAPSSLRYPIARRVLAENVGDDTGTHLMGLNPPRIGDTVDTPLGTGLVKSMKDGEVTVRIDDVSHKFKPEQVRMEMNAPVAHSAAREIVAQVEDVLGIAKMRADNSLRLGVSQKLTTKALARTDPAAALEMVITKQRAKVTHFLDKDTEKLAAFVKGLTDVPLTEELVREWASLSDNISLDAWARSTQLKPNGAPWGLGILSGLGAVGLVPGSTKELGYMMEELLEESKHMENIRFDFPETDVVTAGPNFNAIGRALKTALQKVDPTDLKPGKIIKALLNAGAKSDQLHSVNLAKFLRNKKTLKFEQLETFINGFIVKTPQQISGELGRATSEFRKATEAKAKISKRFNRGGTTLEAVDAATIKVQEAGLRVNRAQGTVDAALPKLVGEAKVPIRLVNFMAPAAQKAHILADVTRAKSGKDLFEVAKKYRDLLTSHGYETNKAYGEKILQRAEKVIDDVDEKAAIMSALLEVQVKEESVLTNKIFDELVTASKQPVFEGGLGGGPFDLQLDLSTEENIRSLVKLYNSAHLLTDAAGTGRDMPIGAMFMNLNAITAFDRELHVMPSLMDHRSVVARGIEKRFLEPWLKTFNEWSEGERLAFNYMSRGYDAAGSPKVLPTRGAYGTDAPQTGWLGADDNKIIPKSIAEAKTRLKELGLDVFHPETNPSGWQIFDMKLFPEFKSVAEKGSRGGRFFILKNTNKVINLEPTPRVRQAVGQYRETVVDPLAKLAGAQPGHFLEHYFARYYDARTMKQLALEGLVNEDKTAALLGSTQRIFEPDQVMLPPTMPLPGSEVMVRMMHSRILPDMGIGIMDPAHVHAMFVRGAAKKIAYDPVLDYWNNVTQRISTKGGSIAKGKPLGERSAIRLKLIRKEITEGEYLNQLREIGADSKWVANDSTSWHSKGSGPSGEHSTRHPIIDEIDQALRDAMGLGNHWSDRLIISKLGSTSRVNAAGQAVTWGEELADKSRWLLGNHSLTEVGNNRWGNLIGAQALASFLKDPGSRPMSRIANTLKMIEFLRKIGFAWSTPIVNSTQWYTNNLSQMEFSPSGLQAIMQTMFFTEEGRNLRRAFKHTGVTNAASMEIDTGTLANIIDRGFRDIVTDPNSTGVQKFANATMKASGWAFEKTENFNQFKAWAIAINEARRGRVYAPEISRKKIFGGGSKRAPAFLKVKPITDETILNLIGISSARRTQFSGKVTKGKAFRDPIGGMLLQFQTYNVRQTGLVYDQFRQSVGGMRELKEKVNQHGWKGFAAWTPESEAVWQNIFAPYKTLASLAGFTGLAIAGGVPVATAYGKFFGFPVFLDERLLANGQAVISMDIPTGPVLDSIATIVNDIVGLATNADKVDAISKLAFDALPVGQGQAQRFRKLLIDHVNTGRDLTTWDTWLIAMGMKHEVAGTGRKSKRKSRRGSRR